MAARFMVRVPLFNTNLNLFIDTSDKTWSLARPFIKDWRRALGGVVGKYQWLIGTNRMILVDQWNRERLALNGFDPDTKPGASGEAIWDTDIGQFRSRPEHHTYTSWECLPRPIPPGSGLWVGLAGKGGIGILGGAEAAGGVIFSTDDMTQGKAFLLTTGKAGLHGGWSGNLAVVIATGIRSDADLQSYAISGWDWSFAIGSKVKQFGDDLQILLKCPFFQWLLNEKAMTLAKAVSAVGQHQDNLVVFAKDCLSTFSIDSEVPSVTMLDLPGPSLEAGLYWYWQAVHGVKSFRGRVPAIHDAAPAASRLPAPPSRPDVREPPGRW